ncbi:MMPL family transporter [Flavobacteriaceae bacterium TP-CH-4]|uniref:MMPL family transporter n=1 Tax=Pelagihabitans pacificus TaxID=2696054 RepID=A0A967AUD1_9FLAO|nr:1-acyl-sn-glycerol-3-phosphate acyltransferase [Pelagihabitans pacificus]NHF60554.1 MMPL family transporter [Pelagihabitans pacificus]
MGRFLLRTYQVIRQKSWASLLGLLLIILGLLAIVRQIQFEDDITSLIPANDEAKRIQKVLKSITFTDKIVVNVQRDDKGTVEDLTQYATEFLDSVQKNNAEFIKNIQGRVNEDDLPITLDLIYNNLPLFLDEGDYQQIQQKLSSDSIAKITEKNYRTLISPSGIVAKKTILKDPFGLSFVALKKLQQLGIGDDFKLKNGFLLDTRETNILLFITPTHSSNATDKNLPFSDQLYALQEQLNTKYQGRIQSEYYGAALVAVANAKQIRKDIQFTVSIAMTLLLILMIFFYRKWALPLILFTPTLFGVLLAVAFLCLIRTKISVISLGIGAVLLGVTLDYALHILTHIRNGKSLESLYYDVAPSIMMSSLTTASAFLCLLFLESQALQDLGIFAAVSVTGASVFALLFIPQVYRTVKAPSKKTLLDRLAAYNVHQSNWSILGVIAITIISMFTYGTVVFNQDLTKLNYEPEILSEARKRLETLTDISSKSIYLSTYGDDQEKVLRKNDSLYATLEQLQQKNEIISFSSIGALVRSKQVQQQKIQAWNDFWQAEKITTTKENLIESGDSLGFKENTFREFYELLEADFEPMEINDFEVVKSFAVDDYIVQDENGTTITSLVKVDEAHIDAIRNRFAGEPNTLLIDRQQVNETFLGNLKNDFNSLIGYSLIVVLLILLFFYQSLSLTLVTSIPIFLTWFLTVGIMGLFHIEFNIFNIIICSFIFGLGVDYSIFITNGLLTEYRSGERTLTTHKTSIILSVITTIAGVGVMIFAKHPVLYTISVVSLIGILCAAFVAFTIQPLLLRLFIGDRKKRPISLRYLVHSILSFGYFGIGGFLLSMYAWVVLTISPKSRMKQNHGFHTIVSKLMGSVLYTNPFVTKKINNPHNENFSEPVMIIANHTSFLDILSIGMLHPKIVFLVNDWVYNSPVFGWAAKLAGAYPVSGGIEHGESYLRKKVKQGFSLIAFPEGTRSTSNKIKRFHKGAFYLAEEIGLDILPVLIHGNSEVLPKGSFIIRDGSITIEILPRIKADDPSFGRTYSARSKAIGTYFKQQFRRLRNTVETETYWHKTILEHYRYKGNTIYSAVKNDLKKQANTYYQIAKELGEKDRVVHLSKNYGQFDLLLSLDAIDRKISLYLEKMEAREIVQNNFLTHQYSKISVVNSLEEVLSVNPNVLIIDTDSIDPTSLPESFMTAIHILIILKDGKSMTPQDAMAFGFEPVVQGEGYLSYKRKKI